MQRISEIIEPQFYTWLLTDDRQTARLGRILSENWYAGLCVFLKGDLGSGKSALARAAIQAAAAREGREELVPSPTFTLIQTYFVESLEVAHCDLYRLSDPEEAEELGLMALLDTGVSLIEWPQRLAFAPADRLEIALSIPEDFIGRRVQIDGYGRCVSLAKQLYQCFHEEYCASLTSASGNIVGQD